MNVFSGFDGISCGRQALHMLGIQVDNYYAAEINKYAIEISQYNYPGITRMGDITKWREWDIDWGSINLVLGGSPCQGFSFSGIGLAFDDPRSKLFFVYVEILCHIESLNPDVKFLLENVKMKKSNLDVISDYLQVSPILINSNLLTAQNRPRYYWTNIEVYPITDHGWFLCHILERDVDEKYFISPEYYNKLTVADSLKDRFAEPVTDIWDPGAVTAITERRTKEARAIRAESMKSTGRDFSPRRGKELVERTDGRANCLTSTFSMKEHTIIDGYGRYRRLTPVEWERLQNLTDGYTSSVSDSQRYIALGNGWTVSVIMHLLRALKKGKSI